MSGNLHCYLSNERRYPSNRDAVVTLTDCDRDAVTAFSTGVKDLKRLTSRSAGDDAGVTAR
jgi:hypothetical protein